MRGHRTPVDGFSLHFYTDFRNGRGRTSAFDAAAWYEVLREGLRTEQVVERHWEVMGKFDPQHRTKLVIDEWGVWYSPGDETAPRHILSQPLTLRDALHTAITFDVFNRLADKVSMANVAQTINCIHSLFLADGGRFVRTPAYSVFELYRPHRGARSIPIKIRAEGLTAPGLSGSASLRDRQVTLTLANSSLDAGVKAQIRLASGSIAEGSGQVLTHADMRAHNTFDKPDEVRLAPLPVVNRNAGVEVSIPKQSVVALQLRLNN
jgi:alpha-N-arabinofuranosidase